MFGLLRYTIQDIPTGSRLYCQSTLGLGLRLASMHRSVTITQVPLNATLALLLYSSKLPNSFTSPTNEFLQVLFFQGVFVVMHHWDYSLLPPRGPDSKAYFSAILCGPWYLECDLGNLKCGQLSHFYMLFISHTSFCALVGICSMQISRTVKYLLQCGIKQQRSSWRFGSLEGRLSILGCGHQDGWSRVWSRVYRSIM